MVPIGYISDAKDSNSTSDYNFTIGGAIVSWNFLKQTCIAK